MLFFVFGIMIGVVLTELGVGYSSGLDLDT